MRTPAIALMGLVVTGASAQYFETPPRVPAPAYDGLNTVSFLLPAGQVSVSNVHLRVLSGRQLYNEMATVQTIFDVAADFDITFGSTTLPASATGVGKAVTIGGLGTFLTTVTAFDLSGTTPFGSFLIRENGPLESEGLTQVQGSMVTGWLAIFTQLSLDGGNSWTSANTSMNLNPVPEPATLAVMGLGVAALLKRRRTTSA